MLDRGTCVRALGRLAHFISLVRCGSEATHSPQARLSVIRYRLQWTTVRRHLCLMCELCLDV